jgi:hypothetical protein
MKRTSDEKIMEIYQKDATAFRQVADQRGERIPAGVMNFIVWKFLQVYETLGKAMVDEHLAYEIEKYARKNCATATSRISIYFSSPMNRAARRHAIMLVGYSVSGWQGCS